MTYFPPDVEKRAREIEHTRKERHEEIKRVSITQPKNYQKMTRAEAEYAATGKKIRPHKPKDEDYNSFEARYGFHGYTTHPTHFLAGEAGRERINIHKTQKHNHDDFWNVSKYFGGRF
jgi:hypothetical protein